MFKRYFLLLSLLLSPLSYSSVDVTGYPLRAPPRSVQLDLHPPSGFEDLIVKIVFSEESRFRIHSMVLDTGASIHEIDLQELKIEWPIDLNEFGPFMEGGKATYDSVFIYLFYGPRTRVKCGEENFEWARKAKKITVYPEEPPSMETSNIHFELCERKREWAGEREE